MNHGSLQNRISGKYLTIAFFLASFTAAGIFTVYAFADFQKKYALGHMLEQCEKIKQELEKCIYDRSEVVMSKCTNNSRTLNSTLLSPDDYADSYIESITIKGYDTTRSPLTDTDIALITVKQKKYLFTEAATKYFAVQISPEHQLKLYDRESPNYRFHLEKPEISEHKTILPADDNEESYWRRNPYHHFANDSDAEKIRLLKKLHDDENGITDYLIGSVYEHSDELKDNEKAMHYYLLSAERGNTSAYLNIGLMHFHEKTDNADRTEGFKYIQKAAALNNLQALNFLAGLYAEGIYVPRDMNSAVNYYRRAADNGSPEASYRLGSIYSSTESDFFNMDTACFFFKKAANMNYEQEDIYAALGDCRLHQDHDVITAYRMYRKGAELNQPKSLIKTAKALLNTENPEPSQIKEAEKLLLRAAVLKTPESYGILAHLYYHLLQSVDKAEKFALKGVKLKDSLSNEILADIYITSVKDIPNAQETIIRFLTDAAEQGSISATDRLIDYLYSLKTASSDISPWIARSEKCHRYLKTAVPQNILKIKKNLNSSITADKTENTSKCHNPYTGW